jgi:hypothetical protein
MQPWQSRRTIIFNVVLWFMTVMFKNGVVEVAGQADGAPLGQPCTVAVSSHVQVTRTSKCNFGTASHAHWTAKWARRKCILGRP